MTQSINIHQSKYLHTFTNDHLKNMLNTIHYENKSAQIAGNFNVNLINYNKKEAHNFTPQVTLPTRVNEKSAILIDNIFVNNLSSNVKPTNLSSIFKVTSQLQFLTIFPSLSC